MQEVLHLVADLLFRPAMLALARNAGSSGREHPLKSQVRQKILTIVNARHGISMSSLKQEVELGWGALYHQVRRLEEAGLLTTISAGRRRIVVPTTESASPQIVSARALLAGTTILAAAELIASGQVRNVNDAARSLGMSKRATSYHIRNLLSHGLVESTSRTRYVNLRPTTLLLRLLEERSQEGRDTHAPDPPPEDPER